MIAALGKVREQTGREVHFLHTGGAKHYSNHAGIPTDRPLLDTNKDLYETLKKTKSPHDMMATSIQTNIDVIDTAEAHGDVAIVQAALKLRRVYRVDSQSPTWPVCHISDTIALYLHIMRKILQGDEIGYGRNGVYFAASGSIVWDVIYSAFARALAKRHYVDDETVLSADDDILQRMGDALDVSPAVVPVLLGGKCTFTPRHGNLIGWKAQYPPEHMVEAADTEVDLIINDLKSNKPKATIQ